MLTKKIVVNGQEMVMSSNDGRSWFLRQESMIEFEQRLRQSSKLEGDDLEAFEPHALEVEDNLLTMNMAK